MTATPAPAPAPAPAMTTSTPPWLGAIAFEWTKIASVRSTRWIIISAILITAGGSWLLGTSALASGLNGFATAMPAPYLAFQTMLVAQIAIVLLATLAISSEYSTGAIVTTLQSVPVRGRMLAGKSLVVALGSALVGVVLIGVGTPIAAASAAEFGTFTAADLVRALIGTGIGFAFLSLLVLGLGTALRSAAGTILATLAILQVLPVALPLFNQDWATDLVQYLPNQAITVLATHPSEPYTWPVALAVLAGWAAASLAAGYTALRLRDA
ncbi:ABC transporter [Ruania zhangjianzhongii]|uniref:ABC transporter n=1 Tax=Ruania zhangjianzhongii TaxID=2603206 RepID=UPI0011C91048|nr:ABC transporter [Ruania zhangjianzhongii]